MKSVVLFAVAALGMSFVQLDKKSGYIKQNEPVITSVETTMSYEPGLVTIRGQNFDMVSRVEIDGAPIEVVRSSPNEIVIRKDIVDPGFATLGLARPSGSSVKGTIEFTPSLRAARLGNGLQTTVNPGQHGYIWVNWSLRLLDDPFQVPGTHYPLLLDLSNASRSGSLWSGFSPDGLPVVVTAPFPTEGGLLELVELRQALHLQAWCLLGDGNDQSHTNMATVDHGNILQRKLED